MKEKRICLLNLSLQIFLKCNIFIWVSSSRIFLISSPRLPNSSKLFFSPFCLWRSWSTIFYMLFIVTFSIASLFQHALQITILSLFSNFAPVSVFFSFQIILGLFSPSISYLIKSLLLWYLSFPKGSNCSHQRLVTNFCYYLSQGNFRYNSDMLCKDYMLFNFTQTLQ